jgi:acetylglutamate kinase
MQLIKVGGNELSDSGFLEGLGAALAGLAEAAVIVHGGGQAIAQLQAQLGLEHIKVDGLRVTDAASLEVGQMVLSGKVNKSIVAALLAAGVDALGLSGVDGGLLRCVKKQHPTVDLGHVGEIVETRSGLLEILIDQGMTPVISPISLGLDGGIYNVNADEAAGALAASLRVEAVAFVSNVPAVLDGAGRPIPVLSPARAGELIQNAVITGGMVPKVRAALDVIAQGVPQARIVDLAGLLTGGGTLFSGV